MDSCKFVLLEKNEPDSTRRFNRLSILKAVNDCW